MKKLILGSLLAGTLALNASAANKEVLPGMADKAINGAINLVTGVVEVPMQIGKGYTNGVGFIENEAGSKTVGTVIGVFSGFGNFASRMVWGGVELFGFWTANPQDYKGVGLPFDAKYSWEWGTQYDMFDPTFTEGALKPVGRKLARGAANMFTSIIEVPAQTIKGADEGDAVKGLGKGVWFWFSRGFYGFGEIVTCIASTPLEQPGYAWTGVYPWSDLIGKPNESLIK